MRNTGPITLVLLLVAGTLAGCRHGGEEPAFCESIGDCEVEEVAAGGFLPWSHVCARLSSGRVACWSDPAVTDSFSHEIDAPALVPDLDDAVELRAGGLQTCAVRATGGVVCWGVNFGQLTPGESEPVVELPVADALHVAPGGIHVCILHRNHSVSCMGSDTYGQRGDGGGPVPFSFDDVTMPELRSVEGLFAVRELVSGHHHSCALQYDGRVLCWGSNDAGQLGLAASERCTLNATGAEVPCESAPVEVPGLTDIVHLAAGAASTCAVDRVGEVRCWGLIGEGRADLPEEVCAGSGECIATPTVVADLGDVRRLSVGTEHACALLQDGTLRCWGAPSLGALGDGTSLPRAAPGVDPGLAGVIQVSAGHHVTCATLDSHQVRCWGGIPSAQPVPAPMLGFEEASDPTAR